MSVNSEPVYIPGLMILHVEQYHARDACMFAEPPSDSPFFLGRTVHNIKINQRSKKQTASNVASTTFLCATR